MRGAANPDRAFWSKPADAEAGWMDHLSSEPLESVDAAETQALDEFAAGRDAPTDSVFHELRDIAVVAPTSGDTGPTGGSPDDPDDTLPPAAAAGFDFDAVTDDLLPSWNLDLG